MLRTGSTDLTLLPADARRVDAKAGLRANLANEQNGPDAASNLVHLVGVAISVPWNCFANA
jgi:hypothetical protein